MQTWVCIFSIYESNIYLFLYNTKPHRALRTGGVLIHPLKALSVKNQETCAETGLVRTQCWYKKKTAPAGKTTEVVSRPAGAGYCGRLVWSEYFRRVEERHPLFFNSRHCLQHCFDKSMKTFIHLLSVFLVEGNVAF